MKGLINFQGNGSVLAHTIALILKEKYNVNIVSDCVIVSVVANNVKHNEQIQKVHNLISTNESIYMIHFGANNLSLSCVVNKNYGLELMESLHSNLIA